MKNVLFALTLLLTLLFISCTGESSEVSIEGRLLHMNQATFYAYSTDGVIDGIDTITVAGGRFEYEREIRHGGTLVIIFPNFSQIPIFVEPGTSVSISGDAARLSEVKVAGDDINEKFSGFRKMHRERSVQAMRQVTEDFIGSDDCNTEVALWLIQQYFLIPKDADVKGAVTMLNKLAQKNSNEVKVKRLLNLLNATGTVSAGDRIEKFETRDVHGNLVTDRTIAQDTCVVMTCATWSYESQNLLRRLNNLSHNHRFNKIMAICLDTKKEEAKGLQDRCNAENVIMICDTMQWESPLMRIFGLTTVPDKVVLVNGKVCNIDVTK